MDFGQFPQIRSFAYSIPLMLPEVLNQLNQLRRSNQLNQPN